MNSFRAGLQPCFSLAPASGATGRNRLFALNRKHSRPAVRQRRRTAYVARRSVLLFPNEGVPSESGPRCPLFRSMSQVSVRTQSAARMCIDASQSNSRDSSSVSDSATNKLGTEEICNESDAVQHHRCEVELRNVTLQYGDNKILDDVSLTINRGEALALIGPSGMHLVSNFP